MVSSGSFRCSFLPAPNRGRVGQHRGAPSHQCRDRKCSSLPTALAHFLGAGGFVGSSESLEESEMLWRRRKAHAGWRHRNRSWHTFSLKQVIVHNQHKPLGGSNSILTLVLRERDLGLWCIPPEFGPSLRYIIVSSTPCLLRLPRERAKMMGDAGDGTYRMYLGSTAGSRASAARQHQHQHQYPHGTTPGNLLDLTDFGDVHSNTNSPSAQQQYVRELRRELAGVPPDSYGNTGLPPSEIVAPTSLTIICHRKGSIHP